MRQLLASTLAILFAGCVASDATVLTTSEAPPSVSPTAVAGTVLNKELAPVAGAVVQLDKDEPVLTDDAGAFRIPTTAGDHVVTVQAIDYVSIGRTVTVVDGEAAQVQFILDSVEIIIPYKETQIYDGYDICSYAIITNIGTLSPCPLGTPKNGIDFQLKTSWRYFVLELAWEGTNSFWVSINTPGSGCLNTAPCPGVEIGRSPVRIDGAPENPAIAKRWALDGKKMYANGSQNLRASNNYAGELRHEMNATLYSQCGMVWGHPSIGVAPRLGCPIGVGFSTGIRFQEYITIFHWEPLSEPMKFTALPPG